MMSDNETFSQLVMPYTRKMWAVAYHILQRGDEAEDLVQDIMVKLWEMRDRMPSGTMLEPYIMTMTRNLCIDRIRSRHEYQCSDEEQLEWLDLQGDGAPPDAADESDPVESRDRLHATLRLIAQLPPDQARVLRCKVFDELQNSQIAQLMQTTEDNVRQLLSRARRKLKELAIKQGVI